MDIRRYFVVKPIKHQIARGFLLLSLILSVSSAISSYSSGKTSYMLGSIFIVLLTPLVLSLGRDKRFQWLPLLFAILFPISFQFPAAVYSLDADGHIFWYISAPVFFFGLSNFYIGSGLSVMLLLTLLGNYFYHLTFQHTVLLPGGEFASLITSYLFVVLLLWINERDRISEEGLLNETASLDFLTKVQNRRGMEAAIRQNQSLLDRYQTPCAVILLDLDNFKEVNDRYGHAVGDDVLINLSSLCSVNLRSTDILGRWGGEEFVIVTPGLPATKAKELAEKLRQLLMSHRHVDVGVVTASFGVVGMHKGESTKSLMARVDELMYQAKQAKNCVRVSE